MTERSELQEVWADYSAGLQLSDAQHECLQKSFNDGRYGSELVADLQINRTLETLKEIEESGQTFVDHVSAACLGVRPEEKPERQVTPPPILARPRLAEVTVSTPGTFRRQKRSSLWTNPVMVILAGSSFAMVVLLAVMVERYSSMKQQMVKVTDRLESQRKEFGRQIIAERTRQQQAAVPPSKQDVQPVVTQQTPVPPPTSEVPESFARLTRSENAVWRTDPVSTSLPPGEWELKSGSTELTLIGGSRLQIEGPANINLIGPQHVALHRGVLTASVPPEDIGFRISTPTSRIIDLGTKFRVSVSDDGQTDVELLQGEVVVVPWDDGPTGKRWRLAKNRFERATVAPSAEDGQRMLVSQVVGPDGFLGHIRLAGASIDIDSRADFDRLQEGVRTKLATSPNETAADWLDLTRALNATTGSVTLNGEEIPISGLEGVLNFENGLLNAGNFPSASSSQQNSSFSGTVNINGQQRTFSNQKEYEAFRKEMFQSLPGFGLPGPAQSQFDVDKQSNPFQPK